MAVETLVLTGGVLIRPASRFFDSTRIPCRSSPLSITFRITRTSSSRRIQRPAIQIRIVKLGVVNAAGGDIRWIDTFKYQPADLLDLARRVDS